MDQKPRKAKKPRLTRQEKAIRNRNALIDAAALVVGEVGYEKASIARITETANLAHGTFYLYFEDRLDLFNQTLPLKGKDIQAYLRDAIRGADSVLEMERRGLLTFQAYVQENPWFFRLLHEGRYVAPLGHAEHLENLRTGFIRSLKRWRDKGEMRAMTDAQLEPLAMLMIGARDYLFARSTPQGTVFAPLSDESLEAYLSLLRNGLGAP